MIYQTSNFLFNLKNVSFGSFDFQFLKFLLKNRYKITLTLLTFLWYTKDVNTIER